MQKNEKTTDYKASIIMELRKKLHNIPEDKKNKGYNTTTTKKHNQGKRKTEYHSYKRFQLVITINKLKKMEKEKDKSKDAATYLQSIGLKITIT